MKQEEQDLSTYNRNLNLRTLKVKTKIVQGKLYHQQQHGGGQKAGEEYDEGIDDVFTSRTKISKLIRNQRTFMLKLSSWK